MLENNDDFGLNIASVREAHEPLINRIDFGHCYEQRNSNTTNAASPARVEGSVETQNAARPAGGAQESERPTRGAQEFERPTRGAQEFERPTRGAQEFERPTRGAQESERPTRGAQESVRPTRGAQEYVRPAGAEVKEFHPEYEKMSPGKVVVYPQKEGNDGSTFENKDTKSAQDNHERPSAQNSEGRSGGLAEKYAVHLETLSGDAEEQIHQLPATEQAEIERLTNEEPDALMPYLEENHPELHATMVEMQNKHDEIEQLETSSQVAEPDRLNFVQRRAR